ncbi:lipase 3-like [Schistocerca piceifrons]|uniref:lipase 3-like n=1 Tax=Schistocerca piceifrons TaxID=274613 RepID=UPI001F5FCA63|nr:lipase 3-like [Schistocerca piceifrons]
MCGPPDGAARVAMESPRSATAGAALSLVMMAATAGAYVFSYDADIFRTTCELAATAGYHCEEHVVRTRDGYLLALHRLPPRASAGARRGPVLLVHGILGASDNWILAGRGEALGYLLADEGFDVFMANFRGNFYSRRHESLSPNDPAFWRFSWQEMGEHDLPAMLAAARRLSRWPGAPLVVSHSMGAAALSVLMSSPRGASPPGPGHSRGAPPPGHGLARVDSPAAVRAAVCLAPAVFLAPPRRPFGRLLLEYFPDVAMAMERVNKFELLPRTRSMARLFESFCSPRATTHSYCVALFSYIMGYDLPQLDQDRLPSILTHILSGTSTRTVIHFVQNHKADEFRAFDHGPEGNVRFYNQSTPPRFDLRHYDSTPVAVFYADNDYALTVKEVQRFYELLPRRIGMFRVPYDNFTHIDFLIARDQRRLLNDRVVDILKRY